MSASNYQKSNITIDRLIVFLDSKSYPVVGQEISNFRLKVLIDHHPGKSCEWLIQMTPLVHHGIHQKMSEECQATQAHPVLWSIARVNDT